MTDQKPENSEQHPQVRVDCGVRVQYKRITKKEVSECLRSFIGWKFSYSFKEDQRLILSEYANIDAMTEVLNERGIRVAGFKMPVSPITGYIALVKAC